MTVVDASVILAALLDSSSPAAEALASVEEAVVPAVLARTEVMDTLRSHVLRERLTHTEAARAVRRLGRLVLRERAELDYDRLWELQANIRPYDAAYVALAEQLTVPLLTRDGRLAKAPGSRCAFQMVA